MPQFLTDPDWLALILAAVVACAGLGRWLWSRRKRESRQQEAVPHADETQRTPTSVKDLQPFHSATPMVHPDRRFFWGDVFDDLGEAKRAAGERGVPLFIVIYDAEHPTRSKLDYSLGYFMEYQTTKNLVNENFVQVLIESKKEGAAALVPADDPLENCRLVLLTPDGGILRSEEVYANPTEGLKRVREDIRKWEDIGGNST